VHLGNSGGEVVWLSWKAPDVDPGNRSRVNESTHPDRLGRELEHETHQAHTEQIIRKL
jgi:hypothetical protein